MRSEPISSTRNSAVLTMLGARVRFQSNISGGEETLVQLLERAYACSYGSPMEASERKIEYWGYWGLQMTQKNLE